MKGATIFLILFGLITAGIGALFTALMWDSYQRASAMHQWPQVEAVILSSEIEERQLSEFIPKEYRVKLLYGYTWQSEPITGNKISFRGNPWAKERAKIEKSLTNFPVGKNLSVFVNPSDPSTAVIKPDTKAAGYSIWFPLLFVVGGLGITVRAFRK